MDRRSFLATGATLALLPLTEAPALAAIAAKRRAATRSSTPCSRTSSRSGCAIRPSSPPRSASTRGRTPRSSRSSTRDLRPSRAREDPRAQPPRDRPAERDQPRNACPKPAKLNREVVLYSLDTATVAPARWDIDSRAAALSDHPAGRRLFRTSRTSSTPRTRSTMRPTPKPICRACSNSRPCSTTTPPSSARRPRAASSRRPGRSTWRSARCASCAMSRRSRARWSIRIAQPHRARRASPATGSGARRAIVAKQRLSRARPPDRGDGAACARRRRPGDGAWRLTERRSDLCRGAAPRRRPPTSTPGRGPPDGPRPGRRDHAPSSTRSCKSQGYTQGSVGERLAALNKNSGAALCRQRRRPRRAARQSQRGRQGHVRAASAASRRCPTSRSKSAACRRKSRTARPTAITAARRSMARARRSTSSISRTSATGRNITLPTLSYHEGVPGHHLQISIAQKSKDIPTLRKLGFFSAYSEGWALYAEQLADELGVYANDPLGRAGFLQSFLFRAARLVVDTGLHSKRWSREQATDYMVADHRLRAAALAARGRALLHADRPGVQLQGRPHRLDSRSRRSARRRSAPKFDIKQFHEVLREGAMPLSILERRIRERTAAASADARAAAAGQCATASRSFRDIRGSVSCRYLLALADRRRLRLRRRCRRKAALRLPLASEDARFAAFGDRAIDEYLKLDPVMRHPARRASLRRPAAATSPPPAARRSVPSPSARLPSSRSSIAPSSAASIRSTRSCCKDQLDYHHLQRPAAAGLGVGPADLFRHGGDGFFSLHVARVRAASRCGCAPPPDGSRPRRPSFSRRVPRSIPARVPLIHAQTASKQNAGLNSADRRHRRRTRPRFRPPTQARLEQAAARRQGRRRRLPDLARQDAGAQRQGQRADRRPRFTTRSCAWRSNSPLSRQEIRRARRSGDPATFARRCMPSRRAC